MTPTENPEPGCPSSRAALEYVRGLIERNHRLALEWGGADAAPVRCVGIVGAGIMGSAIAAAHARRLQQVVLVDTNQAALERARGQILAELAAELPGREAERLVAHLVSSGASEEPLAGCDLVLETIVEDLGAKRRLYARLEPRLSPQAILASNTSAIPVGRLAAGLADAGRFLGLHFCHPVRGRPLVEVVRGPGTSDRTVARAVTHAHRLGKMPMAVQDGPGFVINRLLLAYLGEALAMVSEGVPLGASSRR